MSIESVPYPTREISDNLPLFLSDIGAVAVPVRVTGTQTIVATKGTTYITYGSGTITFTDPAILTSVSGDHYKVIVGGTSVAVIGSVTYNKVSPIEILRLVSNGAWITHSGLDASQISSGIIDAARLPSYVDDVLEFANLAAFPATGELDKIYVAKDKNEIYRWSGTVYIKVSNLNACTPITLGLNNTAVGTNASAVGYDNDALGTSSSAFGVINQAKKNTSSAFGYSNIADGTGSSAFGNQIITSVANTQEFGIGDGTARLSSVRVHDDGYVALSLRDTATALTDGGAAVGAEIDGTLMRGAYSLRRNGSNLFIDANSSAGTITSKLINEVSLTGSEVLTNKTLTNPTVNNYTEGVVAIGNSGTAKTISLTSGTFQTVTLTASCTFTMPTATAGKSFILKVLTGAGGYTATFTSVKFPDNTAPVVTATAGRYDLFSFIADGTAWSGSVIQNFTP